VGRDSGSGGNRWQGYTHQELYDMLHSGPGAAASGEVADQWSELAGALTDIQQEINAGVRGSGATWVGDAGDAARGALGPFGEWAQQAATASDVMRVSAELQGDLLGKARAAMPAPIAVPQQPGQIGQLLSAQIDFEVAELASNAAAQQAYQVMAQYEAATEDNTGTLGDFGEPPTLVVDTTPITGPVVRSPVDTPDTVGSAPRPATGTTPAPESDDEPPSARRATRPRRPSAEAPVTDGADEAAAAADGTPGTGLAAGRPATPPDGTTPPDGITPPDGTTAPSGTTPSGTTPSSTPATSPGARPDSRPAARQQGSGTTPSSFDPSMDDSPATPGPTIPASRSHDSPASRFPGGALVPAARRADDDDDRDDRDDRHESRYLIEADDIYGDPLTYTPPVIGESPRRR
jgi:PPE family protein